MQPKRPKLVEFVWPFRCVGNGRKKKLFLATNWLFCFPRKRKVQEIMTIQSPTSYIHLFAINMHYTLNLKRKMKKVFVGPSPKNFNKNEHKFFMSLNTSIVSSQDHCWVVQGISTDIILEPRCEAQLGCQVSKLAWLPRDPSKLLSILDYLQLNLHWKTYC